MQRSWKQRLASRKFLSAIGYAVFVFATDVMGWPVSFEAYAAIGGVLGLWILGESYTDGQAVGYDD